MSDILNENLDTVEETTEFTEEVTKTPIEEILQRVNPLCVISKATYGEYAVRDIQTNSGWGENPYGDTYAVVPDEMLQGILETKGFCDIVLSEDGTEVVEFTAREIPEIPETPSEEPTEESSVWDEMALAIEEGVNACE